MTDKIDPAHFTEWSDASIREYVQDGTRRMRAIAVPVGPLHGLWDVIFDAEAALKGKDGIVSRGPNRLRQAAAMIATYCPPPDRIEPALSAEEWARKRAGKLDLYHEYVGDTPGSGPRLIAALNDDLPDSDPRKITRAWIETLREVSGCPTHNSELRAMADALESYLPPSE